MIQFILDSSVVRALVYLSINNPPSLGYIGGTRYDKNIIHITHLVPISNIHFTRITTSDAVQKFNHLDLKWIGCFCSDPVDGQHLSEMIKQANGLGVKVFISTSQPGALVDPKVEITPFSMNTSESVSSRVIVNYPHFSSPFINRELHLELFENLNMARLVYTALSFEYTPQRPNARLLLDSFFDTYLTNFYRNNIGNAIRRAESDHLVLLSKFTLLKKRIIELLSIANFDHIELPPDLQDLEDCETNVAKFVIDAQDIEMESEPKESCYLPLPKALESLLLNAPDPFQTESAIQLTFEPPKKSKSGRKKKNILDPFQSHSGVDK